MLTSNLPWIRTRRVENNRDVRRHRNAFYAQNNSDVQSIASRLLAGSSLRVKSELDVMQAS